nr:glycoside hydrolase family 25 protein [Notoacmeibacter sp. MSK16QG-6]
MAWKRYSVTKELYHTRKMMAKELGLVWGAYHLGRPGNPEEQADHFLQFADPQDDELIAIDIEDNDPEKFMSLEDAEIFARRIKSRTGRWPVLYTNGSTSKFIAQRANQYPILSRLQIWYARYRNEIEGVFPLGNWENYALWQFASHINCKGKSTCPYRPLGTAEDIDVNVAPMSKVALKKAWPFGELTPKLVPDEVLVAKTDDAEDEKTVAAETNSDDAGEMIEVASVDEDLVAIPTPMRSPRDPKPADDAVAVASTDESEAGETAPIELATVTTPVEQDGSPALAFAAQPIAKRTATQALANFAAGKAISPAFAKKVEGAEYKTSAARPEKEAIAAVKTDEAKSSSSHKASLKKVGSKTSSPTEKATIVKSTKVAKAKKPAAPKTPIVKAALKTKAVKDETRGLSFLERIQSIVENTPDELPLLGQSTDAQ